jgi:molybdenum cofactor cytidylyltransferase
VTDVTTTPATLLDALLIGPRECVAIVGGGGKTTVMYRLADEAVAAGRTAVVGGTTRFTPPATGKMPLVVAVREHEDPAPAVAAALRKSPSITCTTGRGDKGRWLPISMEQAATISGMRDVGLVVLEADGSRNRPFKAPGDSEPVVPSGTTLVLAMVGLDVIGKPLDAASVHRPERVSQISGVAVGDMVSASCVASVLLSAEGGRKGVPESARWIPVLNKAEAERRDVAEEVARLLLEGGAVAVILTMAASTKPIVAVYRSPAATPTARGD